MSWNRVSVPPASLLSLHLSWYHEHLEISPNTTKSGHFILKLVNKKHPCDTAQRQLSAGQTPGTSGSPTLPFLCSACAPRDLQLPFHILSPPSPTAKGIPQGMLSKGVIEPPVLHKELSPQRDVTTPQHPHELSQCESTKTFQMIQMCDCHTQPFTHLHQGSQDLCSFWLCTFHSLFFVLLWQIKKMFSPQLWVIATLPKNSRVLNCSFPGAAKHIPVFTPAP